MQIYQQPNSVSPTSNSVAGMSALLPVDLNLSVLVLVVISIIVLISNHGSGVM